MNPRVSQLLLSFIVFIASTCLVMSAVFPSDETGDLSVTGLQDKRNLRDDISKMLLKNLRFRDAEELEEPMAKRQKMLVSNLAALLSGLKQRQAEPNMRMPSLRFGK
ncbi:uncharacterized protein [Haliotis cracherodii]|uniref:uncharacterized protein n=1 Tax=Haliotis cracherodii TaxID=6455 RepID=UPI0039EC4E1C